jgi:aryl-alcohol dehydrogenase-like predicted oxidoreductase
MKLGLGTVQFGLDYGISNAAGVTISEDVEIILELAQRKGITLLDTAPVYGKSEEILGNNLSDKHNFCIATKTPSYRKIKIDKADGQYLKETFQISLSRLKQSSLYCLLVHHAEDLLSPNGNILWEAMEELKTAGLVKKIGVSVYSPEQIEKILAQYLPDVIQAPVNVLDQRLIKTGCLKQLKKQGIEVHSRSVFLQGLLLMPTTNLPTHFDPFRPLLESYHKTLQEYGISLLSAALGFVYGLPDIDHVLVGINNKRHLEEIIEAVNTLNSLKQIDFSKYTVTDELMINPSLWSLPQ